MTDSIILEKNKAYMLRRGVNGVSFLMTVLCLVAQLLGTLPYRGQSMTVVLAIDSILEFVNYGSKPFWDITVGIIYSGLYFFIAAKSLFDIVISVRKAKKWFLSPDDNLITRLSTKRTVRMYNVALWRLMLLYAVSYVVWDFEPSGDNVLLFSVFIVMNVLVNALRDFMYKGVIKEPIISAISMGMILEATILFPFMCNGIQPKEIINSVSVVYFSGSVWGVSPQYIFAMIAKSFLLPIFNLIMIISMLRLAREICAKGTVDEKRLKTVTVRNLVFLGCALVAVGFAYKYSGIGEYIISALKNGAFIFVTLLAYMGAKCLGVSSIDTAFADGISDIAKLVEMQESESGTDAIEEVIKERICEADEKEALLEKSFKTDDDEVPVSEFEEAFFDDTLNSVEKGEFEETFSECADEAASEIEFDL